MRLRPLLRSTLVLLTGVFLLGAAADAATIDPDLRARMSGKLAEESAGKSLPVLMIFHELPAVDRAALAAESDWRVRRESLLRDLRAQLQRRAEPVLRQLHDPSAPQKVAGAIRVRPLYLAGALAFEAPAAVIEAIAAETVDATLFHDRTYAFASGPAPAAAAAAPSTAAAPTDTAWGVKWIGAPRVWSELGLTGAGVVVGHIDSGVDVDHPDLIGRLWTNPGEIAGNGVDDDQNGYVDDVHGWDFGAGDADPDDNSATPGHGTHTAGTVAGDGRNGTLTGVAPGARLMAAKVWKDDGTGGSLSMIWEAQQYCVENGARIMTMSLGLSGDIPDLYARNDRFNADNLRDAGAVLFNSAGNDHYLYDPPIELTLTARVPSPWSATGQAHTHTSGVITVGGTGYYNDYVYDGTSRGPADWGPIDPWFDYAFDLGEGLTKPDIAAPGMGINSTIVGGGYSGETWTGTSMACPHAAGTAALLLQKNPSLSPAGIDSLLQTTAVDLGAAGKDNDFGAGRIDAWAAVQATPTALMPDLVLQETLPDFLSDAVLDPGEAAPLAFSLENVSPVQDAVLVEAELAVAPNPWVTVIDANGTFPRLNAHGGTGDNRDDPFELAIAADAPQGYEFTVMVTVSDASGFVRTFDRVWYVGLPEYRTHDAGKLYLTVTDQGSVGYMSQAHNQGEGIGYLDGDSVLYLSSLWAGTDAAYVCNRDFAVDGGDPAEWVTTAEPNGRVRDLGSARSDQTFEATFSDAGHPSPRPLVVRQTSMAYSHEPHDDFVILEYEFTNQGPEPLSPLYAGLFCDLDIGANSNDNQGGTDPARSLTYMYDATGTCYGIARLDGAAHNLTLISNPEYIYPLLYVEDGFKMRHLSGLISLAQTDQAGDWSALTSARLDLAADGGTAKVAFAVVYGESLADLQANVDAANSVYGDFASLEDGEPLPPVGTGRVANAPNPFNPSTTIRFGLERSGYVDLAVYDVAGRRVRTLIAQDYAAGEHRMRWDGRDDRGVDVPSGIYFARLSADGRTLSRKMTLLK